MLMLVFFVTINFKICKVCNTLTHVYYPLLWSLCSKQMSQVHYSCWNAPLTNWCKLLIIARSPVTSVHG